ncbi:GNAT family acetyltransferase [Ligilactobacillus salitolerans]|uniref:GNAT family acetyltransferase n=1 Tax=Ligilactobacillus salitolerans TaxID=1808352 RepID=A0A401IUX8_9LACO|nr:GNAT family N-acetyltransferase [Ligilactobacillus salitolerans]GBG95334.1 GNAT family acetyltransferase [Ligilactobacillus salitolerans]
MENIQLIVKSTNQLTPQELLQIMEERVKVFVVEQNCPYQEVDQKDQTALHVFLKNKDEFIAYSRVVWHDDQVHISFGRVLVAQKFRGQGFGRQIVSTALDQIKHFYPHQDVQIQAQTHLKKFYSSFGFQAISPSYLEDGIPHTDMLLSVD